MSNCLQKLTRPANLGVRWPREYICRERELLVRSGPLRAFRKNDERHGSSIVRPRVPDRRDHVRGRRVFRASLLHVVHQRAILALIRIEIRLLTARHAAAIPGIHLLQMIQRFA